MKLWVDDVRPAPNGYYWCRSVNEAKRVIIKEEHSVCDPLNNYHPWNIIELIDIDHDAGDYANDGGNYIELLNWLEKTNRNYPLRVHTRNHMEAEEMRKIIKHNNWKEVF